MIQALFDDRRRKALNDAIKEGKPLPIQAKKPMEDTMGKNSTLDDESHMDGEIDGGCDVDDGNMDGGPNIDGGITDGGLDEDGEGSDLGWGLEGINGPHTEKFEGMVPLGTGTTIGGYEFTFYRLQLPHKPESGDVRMEIRSGDAIAWEGELSEGVESEIQIPQDSKKVSVTPLNLGTAAANMRISVEDR